MVPRASTGRTGADLHRRLPRSGDGQANDTEPRQRNYPRFEIGRRAAQMLLNKIKNNDLNHNTIDLGYQIYHGNTL